MRALLAALALLLVAAAPAEQSLAERVAAAVRKARPDATVTLVDAHTVKIRIKGRDDGTIATDRIDQFCATSTPAACEVERSTFVRNMVTATVGDTTVTRERLRVVVRSDDYVAAYRAYVAQGRVPGALVTRPLAQGATAMLAADFPTATRIINVSDLDPLGLTVETAMALGEKQTVADLPPVPRLAQLSGKFIALSGYDYGASLILLPERWHDLADAANGTLFVAIPSDGDVLVGIASKDELPKLRTYVAEQYRAASRGISPLVYRWSPQGWVVAE